MASFPVHMLSLGPKNVSRAGKDFHSNSIRSLYICSVVVLWQPCVSKKSTLHQLRKTVLFSALCQCIFQTRGYIKKSLFSLRNRILLTNHKGTLNCSVYHKHSNLKSPNLEMVFTGQEDYEKS